MKSVGIFVSDMVILTILFFTGIWAETARVFMQNSNTSEAWEVIKFVAVPIVLVTPLTWLLNILAINAKPKVFVLTQLIFAVAITGLMYWLYLNVNIDLPVS